MGCCHSAVPAKELLLLMNLFPPILVAVSLSRGSLKWKVSPRHYQGEMFSSYKLKSGRGLQNPQAIDFSSTEESQHITNRWENNEGKKYQSYCKQEVTFIFQRTENKINFQAELFSNLRVAFAPMSIDVFLSVGKTEFINLGSLCCWNEYNKLPLNQMKSLNGFGQQTAGSWS